MGRDSQSMYGVDLSGPPVPMDMQAWSVDHLSRAQVVFTTSRIETFTPDCGSGPDPYLLGLATGSWAKFDDFAGWAEPADGWSAVLDVPGDLFTVTGPGGVTFYAGTLNASKAWRRLARRHKVFIALAGDLAHPADIPAAQDRGRVYAMLCPVTLTVPGKTM
ncbi:MULTISPECIES: hypothetical protein [Streptomyces violaceusniger group]|uniref:hypothetical protein n=1 Tax=Streptomyces violaceusniger group TaxID=2839105 RepID=UPI00117F5946|nr:hypothetical protein [Streptomyces rhizosphaericus]